GARLDLPFRRRRLLDLGDDVHPPLASQGGGEIARRRGAGRHLDQTPGRDLLFVPRHLRLLRPHDSIENVHDLPSPREPAPAFQRAPCSPAQSARIRSTTPSAAPESIASAARLGPCSVISSRPSPCTTMARSDPRSRRTSAIASSRSGS